MSRRRRDAREKASRLRAARAKTLRRRARAAAHGSRRTATAATAAVALAAGGMSATSTSGIVRAGTTDPALRAASTHCGNPRTPSSNPTQLVNVAGELFFIANDGPHGNALWTSDGTAAGTVLLKSFRGDRPSYLTAMGSTVFFVADDGTRGRELWKSDGTPPARSWSRTSDRATTPTTAPAR